jgi:nitronate monooxygenase
LRLLNAGGLGACGVLLMQPDEIRIWARDVRAGSNGSFQLNNWIPDPAPARDSVHEARVREFLGHWGPTVGPEAGEGATPDFAAQCEAMLEAGPRIISSIMGLYPEEFVAKMKARGIAWWATATTSAEARAAVAAGADVIVAQGAEAGGHRGAFNADSGVNHLSVLHRSYATEKPNSFNALILMRFSLETTKRWPDLMHRGQSK